MLVLLVASFGCDSQARDLRWDIGFADGETASRTAVVLTEIRKGGCDSETVVYEAALQVGAAGPTPGELSPGRYGFAARARDVDCVVIAQDCVESELPVEDGLAVTVTMDTLTFPAECDVARCIRGRCRLPDGGLRPLFGPEGSDGGLDSGLDSGAVDGGPDGALDADVGGDEAGTDGCVPGLCRECRLLGAEMPDDDPACGTIDCDGLNHYYVFGAASATGTNFRYHRDYSDLEEGRCASLGVCHAPNTAECNEFEDTVVDACGECLQATTDGCESYADYTSCGGSDRCYQGECAIRCPSHNDGALSCGAFCPLCLGACLGGRSDEGENISCRTFKSSWCYCRE